MKKQLAFKYQRSGVFGILTECSQGFTREHGRERGSQVLLPLLQFKGSKNTKQIKLKFTSFG